jgi:hypothetical protein
MMLDAQAGAAAPVIADGIMRGELYDQFGPLTAHS